MEDIQVPYAEQWFCFEEYETVEKVINVCHDLHIPEIRTCFSWADWERPGGREWFEYFIEKLHAGGIRLMPCLFYTPLHRAMEKPGCTPRTSYPPKDLSAFTEFARIMIEKFGHTFDWIQYWNEPNWKVYWDQDLDPDGKLFAKMVGPAMDVAHKFGKKNVLGGLSPYEPEWVEGMHRRGILQKADAVGIHAFPGTWDEGIERRTNRPWLGLKGEIDFLRSQLRELGSHTEAWYTETGFSTADQEGVKEERKQGQIDFFNELVRCGADRSYWHTILDQAPEVPTDNVLNADLPHDIRAYHFGLTDIDGKPKPVYHHWKKNL